MLLFRTSSVPSDEIFLVLDGLPEGIPELQLHKVLQLLVDVPPYGVGEDGLHARHQHLQLRGLTCSALISVFDYLYFISSSVHHITS